MSKPTLADVEKFFDKAGCSLPGPQATADRLWKMIRPLLTDAERKEVAMEWDHCVHVGEGRHKLDLIGREITKRLEGVLNA